MFKDPKQYYEAIANELIEIIPEEWTHIEIEAIRFESSIDLEIVYFRPDTSEESRVRTKMLPDYFHDLAKVVSNEKKGLYKKCFFKLERNGTFNVDFEY